MDLKNADIDNTPKCVLENELEKSKECSENVDDEPNTEESITIEVEENYFDDENVAADQLPLKTNNIENLER